MGERILLRNKKHPDRTKYVNARDARILVKLGDWELATPAPPVKLPAVKTKPAVKPKPAIKAKPYKRRDLKAER